MRAVILGLAIAVAATPALGAVNNRDIRATVDAYAKAITVGDPAKSSGFCEARSTVVDEFAPHLWTGAGCAGWAKSFVAMERNEGISACTASVGPKGNVVVEGATAYAVYPATVNCTRRGKPLADPGVWTFVLHKGAAGWKIASWTWSTQ
jgi:ketosteroid isomerase-like protein